MSTVTYICPSAHKLSVNLKVDGEAYKIQFANKELHLDSVKDEAVIVVFDKLIETKPSISQLVKKVDQVVAEKLAMDHKNAMARMRGTVTGAVTSTSQLARARLAERDTELAQQGATPEALAEMHQEIDKDIMLTKSSEGDIAPDTRDGFEETIKPVLPMPETEAAESAPKNVFANLTKAAK